MRKPRPPIRIVQEFVVDRNDPTKILGTRPEDFPQLVAECKAAVLTMQTGIVHVARAAGS